MLNVGRTLDKSWQEGVTDKNLFEGYFEVPSWTAGSKERRFYTGHKSISYQESDRPIFNFFEYDTFILPQGYDLSVELIDVKGDSSYTLPFKCSDIFGIGRYIRTDILTAPTSSTFTLDSAIYSAIAGYDARFLINNALLEEKGIFLCRITNPANNAKVLRSFSISDYTFILRDIGTGEISPVTGLAKNWTFELLGHYTMVKEGTELPNTVTSGVVVKNVALGTGEATFKFAFSKDAPVAASSPKLAVVYYSVQNARPQYFDPVSMLQHGTYLKTEKPDFIMESSQLAGLQANSIKYYQSQKKITLVTANPFILEEDDLIYFDVSRIPAGSYRCSSAKIVTKHEAGELEGKTFDLMEYEFTNYDYDLDTVLASLKRKNDVAKAKVAQYLTRTYTVNIDISVAYNRSNSTVIIISPAKPSDLVISDITISGFTLTWVNNEIYDNIYIEYTKNNYLDSEIIELDGEETTYILDILESDTDYKVRIYARRDENPSPFTSYPYVITTDSGVDYQLPIDSYTLLSHDFQDNSTTLLDKTGNSRTGILQPVSPAPSGWTWSGGILVPDTFSLTLDGTTGYIETSHDASKDNGLVDITVEHIFKFNSIGSSSIFLSSKYDTRPGPNNQPLYYFVYRAEKSTKTLSFVIHDVSNFGGASPERKLAISTNVNLSAGVLYYIKASYSSTTKAFNINIANLDTNIFTDATIYHDYTYEGGYSSASSMTTSLANTDSSWWHGVIRGASNFIYGGYLTWGRTAIHKKYYSSSDSHTMLQNRFGVT